MRDPRKFLSTLQMYVVKKSWRLICANIVERVLFDAVNGIDTITQLSKDDFEGGIANLSRGLHYSSSWTSEITFGFNACHKLLGSDFSKFCFVDVGCGKGKVQIQWLKLLRKNKLKQDLYGIDYSKNLVQQASLNYRKVFGADGQFFVADATEFHFAQFGKKLIIYLYNPFDDVILSMLIDRLRHLAVLIVYNNPVHQDVLLTKGYKMVAQKRGFHPQADTSVFSNFDDMITAIDSVASTPGQWLAP